MLTGIVYGILLYAAAIFVALLFRAIFEGIARIATPRPRRPKC